MHWPMVTKDNCDTQRLLFYNFITTWKFTAHYIIEWEILRGNLEIKETKKWLSDVSSEDSNLIVYLMNYNVTNACNSTSNACLESPYHGFWCICIMYNTVFCCDSILAIPMLCCSGLCGCWHVRWLGVVVVSGVCNWRLGRSFCGCFLWLCMIINHCLQWSILLLDK